MTNKDEWFKAVFLTCWTEYISQEKFLELIQQLPLQNVCIGTIEKTKDEKEHFHVVARFYSGVRFSTLKNLCSTMHIERVKTSGATAYSLKEGCFYNDFDLELNTSNNLFIDLINDMSVMEWKYLVKKYPKLIMSHYENLKKMYDDLNS